MLKLDGRLAFILTSHAPPRRRAPHFDWCVSTSAVTGRPWRVVAIPNKEKSETYAVSFGMQWELLLQASRLLIWRKRCSFLRNGYGLLTVVLK